MMGSPFAGKLGPSLVRQSLVPRDLIAKRVLGSSTLVLVRAPAGFGKTTVMYQAQARLEAEGLATAWLTLDRADNDVPRFLSFLVAALINLGLELKSDARPIEVIEAVARHPQPFVLFLDEFELIKDGAVLALVRELIEHLPRGAHLIMVRSAGSAAAVMDCRQCAKAAEWPT
jgi:LuxR family maltose regulon positive regulatory protein